MPCGHSFLHSSGEFGYKDALVSYSPDFPIMRIPNIYTPNPLAADQVVELDPNAANHIAKVLRMKAGDALQLFNGDGFFYPARIIEASKKSVLAQTQDAIESESESSLHTHLGQVISRGDRMDYAIQKATELGVNEITPLFSARCEVKLNKERQQKRQVHWQQVAIHAAEQCGRACIPIIHPPQQVEEWSNGKSESGLALVLHHRAAQNLNALPVPSRVSLLIGPEGGLSAEEIDSTLSKGFLACTFGRRVLRTETAPVTSLSVLQWLWGDF